MFRQTRPRGRSCLSRVLLPCLPPSYECKLSASILVSPPCCGEFPLFEQLAVALQFCFETGPFEHLTIDYAARDPALLYVENGAHIGSAISGKTLVSPAKRMRRQDHIVQLENWIIRIGRLRLED